MHVRISHYKENIITKKYSNYKEKIVYIRRKDLWLWDIQFYQDTHNKKQHVFTVKIC